MPDVRAATIDDRLEILALLREMIPGVDAEARWRWLYETNPGGRALTWLSTEGDQIAGCTSFFPFRLWLDGEIVHAALGGDGFVRPEFRRTGRGFAMHNASWSSMWQHRIGCMYGAPGAMNVTPLKRSGSVEIGHVARWVRPIRASALGLRVLGRLVVAKPSRTAELVPMLPHDPRVDRVWAEARAELRLAAVRDAAFYTWRFLAAPAGRQHAFVIVDHGVPIGACALEVTQHGRVLRIVDLICVPGAWHAGLRALTRHAAEQTEADTIDIKLFARDGRRRQMWRSGFTERESKPFLCMIPKSGDRRFLDPERWYYTGADSDLDTLDDQPAAPPPAPAVAAPPVYPVVYRRSTHTSPPTSVIG